MQSPVRIGLIGDRDEKVKAHGAIPGALGLIEEASGVRIEPVWLNTASLEGDAGSRLEGFDGLWCVPGSPYASIEGALAAIRFARAEGVPFLGTCGGFQHAVIEYARNVMGLTEATHAESHPGTGIPLVTPLTCSLVGLEGRIRLLPGSRLAQIYRTLEARERYHCNYGLSKGSAVMFDDSELKISGFDDAGEPRAFELEGHKFFLGTLFQPELSALSGLAHPVIEAFVKAAA